MLRSVHEGSLENRFPRNAQLEREIRALEESTQALHLAAGLHAVADLWPIFVQFAAQTLTTVPWKAGEKSRFELATGSVFELQFGQLIHYRLHDLKLRHKFGAHAAPGSWTQGPLNLRRLATRPPGQFLLDPFVEIYIPDVKFFDLALKEFQAVKLDSIALDIPFSSISVSDPPRKLAEYITLERILRFGATPGCKGRQ